MNREKEGRRQMKIYEGNAVLKWRRSRAKEICLEFLAALAVTVLLWVLIIFLFLL
jgi:hypothetical protein